MTQLGTKKSRKGCTRCKSRRVKCNEEAPCANCRRRGEQCSLAQPSPTKSERAFDSSLPANAQEWMEDMELMHHYDTHVSHQPLGVREKVSDLWRAQIPLNAFKHPFLLHGLLALSALNLAYLRPLEAQRYLQLCDKHQAIALSGFRKVLSGAITLEVSDALFALASTISISSMARSSAIAAAMPEPKFIDMDDVTELFFLTRFPAVLAPYASALPSSPCAPLCPTANSVCRGVRDVIEVAHDFIKQGSLASMFTGHTMPESEEERLALPLSVVSRFNALEEMLQYSCEPEHYSDCLAALADLQQIYRHTRYFMLTEDLETGQVWRWTVMVSSEFVRLIQVKHTPTLLLLAYFAAATSAVRTAWYTTNWGEYCLQGISMALEPDMQHWLEWPVEQAHLQMAALRLDE